MSLPTNRRRFLQIVASTSFVATSAMTTNNTQVLAKETNIKQPLYKWKGNALGGKAEILLPAGPDAERLGAKIISEVQRLEKIFSLYIPDSEINLLNREGKVLSPSPEFYELLSLANRFSKLTRGSFDITVQPLWQYHSEIQDYPENTRERLENTVRELVGYQALSIEQHEISFTKDGMAITLNGIAQGYITDCIARLLANEGFNNSLVNLGEIKAIGQHPTGRKWKVNIASPKSDITGNPFPDISLENGRAIATSSPQGTSLRDGSSHLINPYVKTNNYSYLSLSVIANDATTADALSTGLLFKTPQQIKAISSNLNGIKIFSLDKSRQVRTFI